MIWSQKREAFEETLRVLLNGGEPPSELMEILDFAFGLGVPPWSGSAKPEVVIHPISGNRRPLSVDFETAAAKILAALEKFSDGLETKKGFFDLWRRLPLRAPEVWKIPAHAGQPLYSLFETASLASAAAAAWPRPVLLIFTLGGVQEYISASRRTQDLWMASFLLSWLSWQAMKVAVERYGPDVVLMPHLWGQPLMDRDYFFDLCNKDLNFQEKLRVANLPNRFSLLLPEEEAEKTAWEMAEAVRQALARAEGAVRGALAEATGEPLEAKLWKRQREAFLERLGVFWALASFREIGSPEPSGERESLLLTFLREISSSSGEARGLGAAYEAAGGLLQRVSRSLKVFRPFSQRPDPGEKCSLCGEFAAEGAEHLSYRELRERFDRWRKKAFRRFRGELKLAGRLRRGEVLCSVCLTKRLSCEAFFKEELRLDHHLFPSTADLAVAPFRETVLRHWEAVRPEVEEFVSEIQPLIQEIGVYANPLPRLRKIAGEDPLLKQFLRVDGEWFFEESFDPERVGRIYGPELKGLLESPLRALRKLLKRIDRLVAKGRWSGPVRPSRYYALVVADGDHMGRLLSGRTGRGSEKDGEKRRPFWKNFWIRQENLPPEWSGLPLPITPHYHRFVAERLRRFALELAPEVVEGRLARLVYAGGDDVLALCALPETLEIMENLQKAYSSPEVFDGGASLSVAAVVAHHRTPFYLVVREGLKLLKEYVKDGLRRNAWGIEIRRRAGERTLLGAGFENGVLSVFKRVRAHFAEGRISPRLRAHLAPLVPGLLALPSGEIERVIAHLVQRAFDPSGRFAAHRGEEGRRVRRETVRDFLDLYRRLKEFCEGREIPGLRSLELFSDHLAGACFLAGRE